MSIKLIVNADDYGFTANISRGIRAAHKNGIVTSTTCMMNFPTAVADIAAAQAETPGLGLGVHLVLTAGAPMLPAAQVPSLVDETGHFRSIMDQIAHLDQINADELRAEWTAQIEAFVQAAGRAPTHLDSHHHMSYYTELNFQLQLELAQKYNCAIRPFTEQSRPGALDGIAPQFFDAVSEFAPRLLAQYQPRRADAFYSDFYDETATIATVAAVAAALPASGTFELMVHPGYNDAILEAADSYTQMRETELAVLTDEASKAALAARGVVLVSY